MILIMKDHKNCPRRKESTGTAFFSGVVFTLIAVVFVFSMLSQEVKAESDQDYSISPDMAPYIERIWHGKDLSICDTE